MSNLADHLAAAGFPLKGRQLFDCGDAMDCAYSIRLAESVLRHLGQDEDAQRLHDLEHALGLDGFMESPEVHALATIMLQNESKRRPERKHEA